MKKASETAQTLLEESYKHFRRGEDEEGLQCFLEGIGRLEKMTAFDFDMSKTEFDGLVGDAEKMLFCVQNADITGLCDILEYSFCLALGGKSAGGGTNGSDKLRG